MPTFLSSPRRALDGVVVVMAAVRAPIVVLPMIRMVDAVALAVVVMMVVVVVAAWKGPAFGDSSIAASR